jgi:hypothetical protein
MSGALRLLPPVSFPGIDTENFTFLCTTNKFRTSHKSNSYEVAECTACGKKQHCFALDSNIMVT